MNPTQPGKLFWLVLLACFWALFGLTGRDAWQADEARTLGDILAVLEDGTPLWGTPAPLFSLVAGLLAWLSPFSLDLQDSARLASGVFTLLALLATGMAARYLLGGGFGAAAALALMGGFGFMLRAHALLPETALMATWALLLWGMGLARVRPDAGGVLMGLSLAALTLGLRGLPDLLAALLILLLPLGSAAWRERAYLRALRLGLAVGAMIILAGLLWLAQTGGLPLWWQGHARILPMMSVARLFSELAWFAWPLWPLALAAIWHDHRRLARASSLHVPLVAALVLLLAALAPAWSRLGGALPALVPLALLAALALEHLRRGAAQAFYWFGVLCFSFFAFAFWVYFSAIEWGAPAGLARHVARLTPAYTPGVVDGGAIGLAVAASVLWLLAIPLFPRAQIRPVLVWATGMVLTWILLMSLFRPWAEAGWGYRPLMASLAGKLPAGACLTARVDPAMAAMLRFHLGAMYQPDEVAPCAYRLEAVPRQAPSPAGEVLWEGFRPRYKHQVYRLVSFTADAAAAPTPRPERPVRP